MTIHNKLIDAVAANTDQVFWASSDSLAELDLEVSRARNGVYTKQPRSENKSYRFATWYDGSNKSLDTIYSAWRETAQKNTVDTNSICFMYSGQGSQFVGMGSDLWTSWEWFRRDLSKLFALVEPNVGIKLADVMLGKDKYGDKLQQTNFTQPIVYALEVLLTKVWKRWGLKPTEVMGHSLGEFAAAYASGVISDIQGMKMVAERGRIMQTLKVDGKYVFVNGDISDVVNIVSPYSSTVSMAGINGPDMSVVSGPSIDIDVVINKCEQLGMRVQTLPVSLPFHSPMMRPILDEFEEYANHETFSVAHTPWFSTMTGGVISSRLPIGADYWRRQIEEPVRFWACMENISWAGERNFLEIGPGQSLMHMGRHALADEKTNNWRSSLNRKYSDREALFRTAINLWMDGFDIDLSLVYSDCFDVVSA